MRDRFRARGIATPELDAKLLALHAWKTDSIGLLNSEAEPAGADAVAALATLAERRISGEPVARILGEQEFYGLPFALNPATLVPRPETELLVDRALACFGKRAGRLLDLGTGTGCIPIAVLANGPTVRAVAIDLAADAVAMARRNAERNGVTDRLELREGSWFAPLVGGEMFDVIVSNPPYIESASIAGLAREVALYDPVLALDGGPDGLAPYRHIAEQAGRHLLPGGTLMVEIGSTQGHAVQTLLESAGFLQVEVEKDLAGLDRVVIAHHSPR